MQVNTLQEGQGFDEGLDYDIAGYKVMADNFSKDWSSKYYDGNDGTYVITESWNRIFFF